MQICAKMAISDMSTMLDMVSDSKAGSTDYTEQAHLMTCCEEMT